MSNTLSKLPSGNLSPVVPYPDWPYRSYGWPGRNAWPGRVLVARKLWLANTAVLKEWLLVQLGPGSYTDIMQRFATYKGLCLLRQGSTPWAWKRKVRDRLWPDSSRYIRLLHVAVLCLRSVIAVLEFRLRSRCILIHAGCKSEDVIMPDKDTLERVRKAIRPVVEMAGFRQDYWTYLKSLLHTRPREYIALSQEVGPHWRPGPHRRTSQDTERELPLLAHLMPMLIPDRPALWSAVAPHGALLCWSCGPTSANLQCCSRCMVARYCSSVSGDTLERASRSVCGHERALSA